MSIEKYNKIFSIGVISLSLPTSEKLETEVKQAKEKQSDERKEKQKRLNMRVRAGIDYLTENGFAVSVGKTVFPDMSLGYKAASIKDRVNDVHEMFSNQKVNLIMNTIGGYNCNEILEYLDYDLIKKNPKFFVGFSDITSANLALFTKANIKTVNGSHITYYLHDKNSFLNLFQTLNNEKKELACEKFIWEGDLTKTLREPGEIEFLRGKNSTAEGWAIGGNLSTFCLMLGTEYTPDFSGSVLFIEYDKEEDTCLPSLERLMWQIRQNGIFKKINALVFGQLQKDVLKEETRTEKKEGGKAKDIDTLKRILIDVTSGYDFPVLYNTTFGHIYPSWQIINGANVEFSTTKPVTIKIK